MDLEPAAVETSSAWMQHLERAHERAHAAARIIEDHAEPSPHLAPAARQLARGLGAMYDAFDGRSDRVTAIGIAHGRLWDAAIGVAKAGLPEALARLREACGELVAAEERFPRVPIANARVAKLRAGAEAPPLHVVERISLAPSFRAPPQPATEAHVAALDLPEPTTFEELAAAAEAARRFAAERAKRLPRPRPERPAAKPAAAEPAEVPAGFASAPAPAISEEAFIRKWARECFDEVGMLGVQRAPLPGDDWRACQALEKRLVTAIDAIAALGPIAIAHVEPLAMDAPVANPMSIFAAAMIGGCLDGRDALAAAERVLHRFGPGDPNVGGPFASAMKLADNPFIPNAMRSLHASSEPGCRAVALDVLAHRGWLEPRELDALAQDEDPVLLALALPALGVARHPDLARAAERALAMQDARLQAAALEALALGAHPDAASAARAAAAGVLGDRALVALAIVGDMEDARFILERPRTTPSAAAIEALGWAGLVDAVPLLLRWLESEADDAKRAAGAALDRLLGANLVDRIEVMPEALEPVPVIDPDPDPRPNRRTLEELLSDPRERAPAGSSEELEMPSVDPDKWRAHWTEHGARLDPKQRIRRGQAYSPSVSQYELDCLPLSVEERRMLHRELAARTGRVVRFDPHDFVAVQERGLAAWGEVVRGWSGVLGGWGRPVRRG